MDHGSACSPFTLITIRPIDERQLLRLHQQPQLPGALGLPGSWQGPQPLLIERIDGLKF